MIVFFLGGALNSILSRKYYKVEMEVEWLQAKKYNDTGPEHDV